MSKALEIVGGVVNATVDTAINVTAAGAGGIVGAYAINHDVMNDDDMSIVVGAVGGVGTFCVVRGALKTLKEGTISGVNAIRTRLGRGPKRGATT